MNGYTDNADMASKGGAQKDRGSTFGGKGEVK